MRVHITALGLIAVGCGAPVEKIAAPVPPSAALKAVVAAPAKEPEFNSKDVNETLEWAYKRARILRDQERPADAAVSVNALNDELMVQFRKDVQAFRDELNAH